MIDMHIHTIYSDGDKKPDIEIGIGRGNLNISKEVIEDWINL